MQHNDLTPWNVLLRDGRYYLVDFGDAKSHSCKATETIIKMGDKPPYEPEFGCTELYQFAADHLWWSGRPTWSHSLESEYP